MPTVLIWLPEGENTFGHAALQTDAYHISFWPFKGKDWRFSEASVTGRLHFHELLDSISEGSLQTPREPTRHEIVNVTNEDINRVYEEFLSYNEIEPQEVTKAAAERYIRDVGQVLEDDDQKQIEIEMRKRSGQCYKNLSRTRYSFVGNVIVDKRTERSYFDLLFFMKRCLTPGWGNIDICRECIDLQMPNRSQRVACPFYHKVQSCVSFCFNLIEMADRRPLVCLVEARDKTRKYPRGPLVFLGSGNICLEITVANFEKHVVQKYWQNDCQRNHYDAYDFQKRSRFLMLSENIFKKVLMIAPTIFSLTWLHEIVNLSYLELFGLTWIIHLMYFMLLYGVGMMLLPSVRLPKVMAILGGIPGIMLFFHIYLSYPTTNEMFDLEMKNIPKFIAGKLPNIINYWVFLLFVEISEFILDFLINMLIG